MGNAIQLNRVVVCQNPERKLYLYPMTLGSDKFPERSHYKASQDSVILTRVLSRDYLVCTASKLNAGFSFHLNIGKDSNTFFLRVAFHDATWEPRRKYSILSNQPFEIMDCTVDDVTNIRKILSV